MTEDEFNGFWGWHVALLEKEGYTELKDFVPAPLGWTELCMSTKTTACKPVRIWISPNGKYADVFLNNDTFIGGCFHQHADKTISLS